MSINIRQKQEAKKDSPYGFLVCFHLITVKEK